MYRRFTDHVRVGVETEHEYTLVDLECWLQIDSYWPERGSESR